MPVDAKVWATPKLCCRCNNPAQHSNQSPKLSVVRDLQRRQGRRRHKLRLQPAFASPQT
jgi:hypothetical protein